MYGLESGVQSLLILSQLLSAHLSSLELFEVHLSPSELELVLALPRTCPHFSAHLSSSQLMVLPRLISALLSSSQLFSTHLSFSLLFPVLLGLSQFPSAFLRTFQFIMSPSQLCSASWLISLLLRSSLRRAFGSSTLLISAVLLV